MSENQFETVMAVLQVLNVKVDSFDTKFDRVEARLDNFDTRFTNVETRLDNFDTRFDKVDAQLDIVSKELQKIQHWTPYHANQDIMERLEALKHG